MRKLLGLALIPMIAACGGEDTVLEDVPPALEEEIFVDHHEEDADDFALAEVFDEELVQITGPGTEGIMLDEELIDPNAPVIDGDDDGFATTASGLAAPHRPHWGSSAHGDGSCNASNHPWWSTRYPGFSIYKWSGCHETVYYKIESSIRSRGRAWIQAVDRAFAAWDRGTRCSPHFVNVTRGPAGAVARINVEMRGSAGHCSSPNAWYACVRRDRARSRSDQHWWMNLNTAHSYGIGASGRLDVQSLVTVELAHILYFGHFPSYSDSVSTSNVGRWGSTRASVPSADVCSFRPHTASCANCGNRRSLKTGDLELLKHLYGPRANGCTTAGQRVCGCSGRPGYSKV